MHPIRTPTELIREVLIAEINTLILECTDSQCMLFDKVVNGDVNSLFVPEQLLKDRLQLVQRTVIRNRKFGTELNPINR
jgi:hypothetical protein